VPEPTNEKAVYRFGLYELDGETGELRKEGKLRPRMQGQPLEILLHLVTRPGDLVTREELRQRLWPADTFVDYDHSLNTAVNKVRDALGDSADNPRFIQTIARRGYRFIASVDVLTDGAAQPEESTPKSGAEPSDTEASPSRKRSFLLSDPHDLPDAPRGVVQFLFSFIQLMYLCFYVMSLARLKWVEPLLAQTIEHPQWLFAILIVTAAVGIPLRLYLLSAAIFGYRGLSLKFLRLFPFVLPLDCLWALAPFLLVDEIGTGLAIAATAALLYLPFSQRSLMLMGDIHPKRAGNI
jgi:DNA-binding winged helix-turn-helix (wHTH) protein